MIKTESLIYGIDEKLNKLSGLVHQEIPIENKVRALNRAQTKLILKKISPLNPLGVGFEGSKKRYQDIEVLVEDSSDHQLPITEKDKYLNRWSSDLSPEKLTPNYMFFVDGYILADKGACKDRLIYINSKLTKHGNVSTLLENPSFCPSFEYQETFCTLAKGSISIYTDGTFTPTSLYLSYIRQPIQMDYTGYVNFDGTDSKVVDCELAAYLEEELLDLAVFEIAAAIEDTPVVQLDQARRQQEE